MKKRIFSGVQPSGNLHIGNYLGAIKNWVELQNTFESIFCVVDMHAITVPQDPETLRKKTLEIAKIYLAAGIDPKKSSIFVQSQVKEHAELMWVLNTITKNGDLNKMTQFKDKTGFDEKTFEDSMRLKAQEKISEIIKKGGVPMNFGADIDYIINAIHNITLNSAIDTYQYFIKERFNDSGVGLFDYPVLMAADILLYDTEVVPVGQDQIQHIELTRTLARRFNKKFGETFIVPEYFVKEEGKMILGLDDPSKKMSKSAKSEYNYIALIDDPDTVRRKIKKAVTDSGTEIIYSDDKPALKNLINIYSSFSNLSPSEIVEKFKGKGYGEFKSELAERVIEFLTPFQERYNKLSDKEVAKILEKGAKNVRKIAHAKMQEVKKNVGFVI